jgi:hypothetical protein
LEGFLTDRAGSTPVVVTARPAILNLRLNSRPDSAAPVRTALGGLAAPFALRAD